MKTLQKTQLLLMLHVFHNTFLGIHFILKAVPSVRVQSYVNFISHCTLVRNTPLIFFDIFPAYVAILTWLNVQTLSLFISGGGSMSVV